MSTETTEQRTTRSLIALLGETRARIVQVLRRDGRTTVAALAAELELSEVAVRRHLGVLSEDGFVAADAARAEDRPERGRPPSTYRLAEDAEQLFPQRYDQLAGQMLEFLQESSGREGVHDFLRWRVGREVGVLRDAVDAASLHERLEQLAGALTDAGFDASVDVEGDGFTLTQDHCTIAQVARDHPEVCTYEAAAFAEVLGHDVTLRRRATLAGGAATCVCQVRPRSATATNGADGPNEVTDPHDPTDVSALHDPSPRPDSAGDPL
ncbi:MAG: ArsR family transcriptional regulator [Nitriliruptoraceae bacterium]|nr:ArsR family transcriptional regulator [Nitriliruptoraceae bacterium]